ncbi:MAG: tetratricopeptide repeat protein [Desulfosarcina sp.]|nr:tetratricopeptide repeat protein [Desulfobacterales bacterium]
MATKSLSKLLVFLMTMIMGGCAFGDREPGAPRAVPRVPPPEAAVAYLKAPDHPEQLALARKLTNQGHYEVAMGRLQACEMDTAEVDYLMGVCLREQGRFDESIDRFEDCLKKTPGHALAHNGIGVALEQRGDPGGAQAAFREAIRLNPARDDFYNNLGYSLMCSGDLAAAEENLRQSLKLDAGNRQAANNLALCLGHMGREREAFGVLMQHYDPAEAYNNMGAIYVLVGQPDKATEMYRKSLSLAPSLSEAARNLQVEPGERPKPQGDNACTVLTPAE